MNLSYEDLRQPLAANFAHVVARQLLTDDQHQGVAKGIQIFERTTCITDLDIAWKRWARRYRETPDLRTQAVFSTLQTLGHAMLYANGATGTFAPEVEQLASGTVSQIWLQRSSRISAETVADTKRAMSCLSAS